VYYFIERMTEEDIEQVQAIERASFSTLWSANTYRHELRSPSTSRYIVARASPTPPPPRAERQPVRRGLLASLLPALFGQQPSLRDVPIVGYGRGLVERRRGAHYYDCRGARVPRSRHRELLLNGLIDQALDLHADVLTLEVRVSNVVASNCI